MYWSSYQTLGNGAISKFSFLVILSYFVVKVVVVIVFLMVRVNGGRASTKSGSILISQVESRICVHNSPSSFQDFVFRDSIFVDEQ